MLKKFLPIALSLVLLASVGTKASAVEGIQGCPDTWGLSFEPTWGNVQAPRGSDLGFRELSGNLAKALDPREAALATNVQVNIDNMGWGPFQLYDPGYFATLPNGRFVGDAELFYYAVEGRLQVKGEVIIRKVNCSNATFPVQPKLVQPPRPAYETEIISPRDYVDRTAQFETLVTREDWSMRLETYLKEVASEVAGFNSGKLKIPDSFPTFGFAPGMRSKFAIVSPPGFVGCL